jgi:hypothetical protein
LAHHLQGMIITKSAVQDTIDYFEIKPD